MRAMDSDWLVPIADQVHELVCTPDAMARFRERVRSGIRKFRALYDDQQQRAERRRDFLIDHPEYCGENAKCPASDWTWEDEAIPEKGIVSGWVLPEFSSAGDADVAPSLFPRGWDDPSWCAYADWPYVALAAIHDAVPSEAGQINPFANAAADPERKCGILATLHKMDAGQLDRNTAGRAVEACLTRVKAEFSAMRETGSACELTSTESHNSVRFDAPMPDGLDSNETFWWGGKRIETLTATEWLIVEVLWRDRGSKREVKLLLDELSLEFGWKPSSADGNFRRHMTGIRRKFAKVGVKFPFERRDGYLFFRPQVRLTGSDGNKGNKGGNKRNKHMRSS